jgi:two-component system chemotaxis response regulator CheY
MKTCLVVDDSLVARVVARRLLGTLHFEVREAANAQDALDACRRGMPDAVLVDWDMPGMDGIAFVRRLRGLPGGKAPFVVLSTSEGDRGHVQTAIAAGADDCFVKPISAEVVGAKFAHVGIVQA